MTDADGRYVTAAGHPALTRFYDPLIALTMREGRFRGALAEQVLDGLPVRATVVDVGCGTGSFIISLAEREIDAELIGVDGDAEALALAQRKPRAEDVRWCQALAAELPLETSSVDAVVMSLVLHHLSPAQKRLALAEAARVLRPGGGIQIADWGTPGDPLMHASFALLRCVDGFANTRDHFAGRIPRFLSEAGFVAVESHLRLRTAFGRLELLSAVAPGPE